MRILSRLMASFLALSLLGACAGYTPDFGPKQAVGTLAGAGAGALAGSQIGKGRGALLATSVGTLLGAFVGSSVGKSLDRADQAHVQKASYQALEFAPTGQQVAWNNPDSGHYGSVTPVRTWQSASGQYCREYSHNVSIDGRLERLYGTACRDAAGQWRGAD